MTEQEQYAAHNGEYMSLDEAFRRCPFLQSFGEAALQEMKAEIESFRVTAESALAPQPENATRESSTVEPEIPREKPKERETILKSVPGDTISVETVTERRETLITPLALPVSTTLRVVTLSDKTIESVPDPYEPSRILPRLSEEFVSPELFVSQIVDKPRDTRIDQVAIADTVPTTSETLEPTQILESTSAHPFTPAPITNNPIVMFEQQSMPYFASEISDAPVPASGYSTTRLETGSHMDSDPEPSTESPAIIIDTNELDESKAKPTSGLAVHTETFIAPNETVNELMPGVVTPAEFHPTAALPTVLETFTEPTEPQKIEEQRIAHDDTEEKLHELPNELAKEFEELCVQVLHKLKTQRPTLPTEKTLGDTDSQHTELIEAQPVTTEDQLNDIIKACRTVLEELALPVDSAHQRALLTAILPPEIIWELELFSENIVQSVDKGTHEDKQWIDPLIADGFTSLLPNIFYLGRLAWFAHTRSKPLVAA